MPLSGALLRGQLVALPFLLGWYFSTDLRVGVPLYALSSLLTSFYLGPSFAMIQSLAPAQQRATVAAIMLFILNLIGLGLGPQLVGVASDPLAPRFGADTLGRSPCLLKAEPLTQRLIQRS